MKKIVSIVLVHLVLVLFFNLSANWHLHKLPNGMVIEHSHPYDKSSNDHSPFQKHNHSDFELVILSLISSTNFGITIIFILIPLFTPLVIKKTFRSNYQLTSYEIVLMSPFRGPPSLY